MKDEPGDRFIAPLGHWASDGPRDEEARSFCE
jgi:hypothetical protein